MKRNSRRAGISLVALVITIIVLIILTGAVIVTFMEGGIIDRAKESVFKNDMRTYQEILSLKRAENQMEIALGEKEDIKINATTLAEIQEIIPEFKEEYEGIVVITDGELSIGERVSGEELSSSEELYSTWLSDLGIGLSRLPKNALSSYAKVGDYVDYMPEGNNESSYLLEGTESGYFTNRTTNDLVDQTITRQNINWRVLKNDGRQVTLISEMPIDNIGFGGAQGFLNGPDLLDDIYSDLYSSSRGKARNLKIEDVNEIMEIEVGTDVKPFYDSDTKGTVEMEAGATLGDVLDIENYDVSQLTMPDEDYRDYELFYMYYANREGHEKEFDIMFKDPTTDEFTEKTFWLSSPCTYVSFIDGYIYFGMRNIFIDEIGRDYFLYSDGSAWGPAHYGRPIIILNSDVEVSNPSAGGDTVATAWQLK